MLDWTNFEWIVFIGAVCGLCMVVGGMILLYKGIITLNQISDNDAVSLEFKKMFKITTQYPALGLFIIGLAFITSAALMSKPSYPPLKIIGKLHPSNPNPSDVTIMITPELQWKLVPSEFRDIDYVKELKVEFIKYSVVAPRYKTKRGQASVKSGIIKLGQIRPLELINKDEKPSKNIESLPEGDSLPPVDDSGAFN